MVLEIYEILDFASKKCQFLVMFWSSKTKKWVNCLKFYRKTNNFLKQNFICNILDTMPYYHLFCGLHNHLGFNFKKILPLTLKRDIYILYNCITIFVLEYKIFEFLSISKNFSHILYIYVFCHFSFYNYL